MRHQIVLNPINDNNRPGSLPTALPVQAVALTESFAHTAREISLRTASDPI